MQKRVNLLEGSIAEGLTRLALPLMGTSLIQMAYNLTDMIWIGRLGAGAVAAVGVGGTYLWLSMGVLAFARVGGQVRVAQNIGANNIEKASSYAQASIQLGALLSILYGAVLLFAANPLVAFYKFNGSQVIYDAEAYMKVVGMGMLFSCMVMLFSSLITTTGNSKTPFMATTVGLFANIILDPVLIFGLWGFPKMGVLGAAIATVLAQVVVFMLLVLYIIKDNHLFCYVNFFGKPDMNYVKDILKLSAPAAAQNILFPLISMVIARNVTSFGDEAVAVQRVGSQIESISWMTSDGFAMAINSFIAQNFGANNIKRVKKGYYTAFGLISVWGVFSSCVLIFAANPIFSMFLSQENILQMGVGYLTILGYSQLFMCWEIITIGAYNGLGKTKLPAAVAVILTALRIPVAGFLSSTALGLDGIWWAISISSVIKGIILASTFILFSRKMKPQNEVQEKIL